MSRVLALAAATAAALFATTPAAQAACPVKPTKQAFAQWLDFAPYVLAEGGSFEGSTTSWSLAGARVGAGNEPYYLNERRDVKSLALGSGATATSPPTCVTLEHPTVRFMVRRTGSPLGVLTVHALVRDGAGLLNVVPMGVVTGLGSAWQPSLPMILTTGLVGSLVDGSATVRFRFTVTGLGGAFQVDDVFVDPYKRG